MDMRTSLITSNEELVELEDRWEELRRECGGTVFASNYLTRAWFEAYSHLASPRVITVEDGKELVGVFSLASYTYHMARLPIKVLALAGEMKDRLRLSTNSPMFRPGRDDVLGLMIAELKKLDWNLLTTINLESNDANRKYMGAVRSSWRTEDFPPARKMTLSLPGEGSVLDTLDKKAQKNILYRQRLLEREGHIIAYRKVPLDGIDDAVDTYARQHIERWESKGGSYFRDPDNVMFLKLCSRLSALEGRGHIYELLIDGRVAAQDFYIVDGRTAYGDKTGMSNEFMRYSPGWFVQVHGLDRIRDMGAEKCVLGIGGEKYKSDLGGVETPLLGIRATRGRASVLGRLGQTSVARFLDARLGLTKRSLDVQEEISDA